MELARVIGTVVATRKYEGLSGVKLLLAEPLDERLEVVGEPFVLADHDQKAGPGDVVSWIGGREAAPSLAALIREHRIDAAIVSVVADVNARSLDEVLS